MPSPTDFNLSPYFDDFNESKKFHRILFRPVVCCSGERVNTITIYFTNQIERFGDHMFKQGAMVIPGQISIDTNYTSIKLTSKTASSLSDYNNSLLTGGTSGVQAKVVGVSLQMVLTPILCLSNMIKQETDNHLFFLIVKRQLRML